MRDWVATVESTHYIIGSVVGVQKYVYDIFGPGVNMAARMETLADPMQIVISEDTWSLVRDEFACTDLGEVEAATAGWAAAVLAGVAGFFQNAAVPGFALLEIVVGGAPCFALISSPPVYSPQTSQLLRYPCLSIR